MSAYIIKETRPGDGTRITQFSQPIPIATYLIAIVVGDLGFKQVGARTRVYTEPILLDKVANELSDLELFLQTAEEFLFAYPWATYNIVVMPPSYPMGGMENPLVTFASPTIIVGDKSQVDVVIHEIMHSWSGNLVTCSNWENLWLNEGFTVYEERKVSQMLHGTNFALTEAYLGYESLKEDLDDFGPNVNWTMLNSINFGGINPDRVFSEVPYEKGFYFLVYLETLVGHDAMQYFLRGWFKNNTNQSVSVNILEGFFNNSMREFYQPPLNHFIEETLGKINWTAWIYDKGYPPVPIDFYNIDILQATNLCEAYMSLNGYESPVNFNKFHGFYTMQ